MSRLFSFGCSFTNHRWPSAADFVGLSFDSHYNYGQGGACNTYIMNQMMEADSIHHFNPDTDYLMIGITGIMRHSFLGLADDWKTTGDIFPVNVHHPKEIQWFSKNLFNSNQGVYDSWIAIKYIKQFLETKKVKYFLYHAIDNSVFYKIASRTPGMFTDKSMFMLNEIVDSVEFESLERFTANLPDTRYTFADNQTDSHPSMEAHLAFAKKYLPQFINDNTYKVLIEQLRVFDKSSMENQSISNMRNFIYKYRKL